MARSVLQANKENHVSVKSHILETRKKWMKCYCPKKTNETVQLTNKIVKYIEVGDRWWPEHVSHTGGRH